MTLEHRRTLRNLLFYLRLFACIGLFYVLYLQLPLESFQRELLRLQMPPLLLAVLGYLAIQLVAALRFSLALAAMEVRVPFPRVIHLHFVSLFFNMFLPGGIGGDAVKGYYLRTSSGHWGKGFLAAMLDRYLGFIGLASLGLASGVMRGAPDIRGVKPLPWILGVLVLAYSVPYFLNAGWVRGILRRLLQRSAWVYDAARSADEAIRAARRPKLLAFCAVLTLTYYLASAGIHLLMGSAFGAELEYWPTLYLIVAIALVSSLPILPGAHGQREGAYVVLFSAYGLSWSQSFLLAALALGMLTVGASIGGVLYLFARGRYAKVTETEVPDAVL